RNAGEGRVVALSAGGLVGEVGLEPRLIFRRQRRLFGPAQRLSPGPLNGAAPTPLAAPFGIFGFIERQRVRDSDVEPRHERERTDQASVLHRVLPAIDRAASVW